MLLCWRRQTLLGLLLVVLAALTTSCQSREAVPQLLTVLDAGPRVVSPGEVIEISGTSFPPKKAARVTFVGSIMRPGHGPDEGVEIEAEGSSPNGAKLEVLLADALVARFCGPKDAALHATFRGDVEVSFAPVTAGALPLTGTLHDVVIDVRPGNDRRAAQAALRDEADRVLSMLGVRVSDDAATTVGGLVVTEVQDDSAASSAGIARGDVLLSLDGWTILDKGDVIPSGKSRFARFGVLRAEIGQVVERQVELRGYKPRGSTDLLAVGLILSGVSTILLFFASPVARWLTWIDRWAGRAALAGHGRKNIVLWLLSCLLSFWRGDAGQAGTEVLPYVVFLVASGLASLLPFGKAALLVEPDAATTFIVPLALSLVVALGSGQHAKTGRYSPVASLKLALWMLAYHLPSAAAGLCVMAMTGSISLADIVRSQSGAPWQMHALKSPVGPLLVLLFFAPIILDRAPARTSIPDAEPLAITGVHALRDRAGVAGSMHWGSMFLLCALGTALLFGGWSLPFVDPGTQSRSFALEALGALLFLVKTWGLSLLCAVLRETFPRVRVDQSGSPLLRFFLPLTAAAAALTAGWLVWDPAPVFRQTISLVGAVMLLALFAHVLRRLSVVVKTAGAHPHVSPFL